MTHLLLKMLTASNDDRIGKFSVKDLCLLGDFLRLLHVFHHVAHSCHDDEGWIRIDQTEIFLHFRGSVSLPPNMPPPPPSFFAGSGLPNKNCFEMTVLGALLWTEVKNEATWAREMRKRTDVNCMLDAGILLPVRIWEMLCRSA